MTLATPVARLRLPWHVHASARRVAFAVLGALALVAAGVGLGRRLSPPAERSTESPPPLAANPSADASVSPPPVETEPATAPAPVAEVAESAPAPTPAPTPKARSRASLPRAPSPAPRIAAASSEAGATGTLQIWVRPYADVTVDDTAVGQSWGKDEGSKKLTLGAGTHVVRLENRYFNPVERRVMVRAGGTTVLEIDLRVDATPK
jgi:hypothetical protein